MKATEGDPDLGGEDFNTCLINHCIKKINDEYYKDFSDDIKSKFRLRKACEAAKNTLS